MDYGCQASRKQGMYPQFYLTAFGRCFHMWNLIVKALKDALKEKVTEMTKEEVKEWLDKIGVKVEEVTDELIAKVEAQKALLDAETRRKTRLFWGPVGFIAGVLCSWLYNVLF